MKEKDLTRKSRSVAVEERIKIARECLEDGRNYAGTAARHNVSYRQVYGWVRKYSESGTAGFEDRRGKRKARQVPRSETEKLEIRIAELEHELYMTKVERDLLKKVKELERIYLCLK